MKSPITSINQHHQPAYDHRSSAIEALSLTVFELDMELRCTHIESINDQLFSQDSLELDAWQHCLTSSSSYNYLGALRSWLLNDTSPNTFQQVISIHFLMVLLIGDLQLEYLDLQLKTIVVILKIDDHLVVWIHIWYYLNYYKHLVNNFIFLF